MTDVSHSPIRFGLIGFGAWGSHHARAVNECPGAELAGVAAHSEASQKAAREAHPDVPVYGDFRELIARDDIDVVDVVLPSHLHFEVAKAALEAGKHVLLEKPMTVSLAHCDELIRIAKEKRRLLAIGHELRLSSLWGKVKEMIDAGAIGEPQYCLVELWRKPYRLGADGWRYDINRVGNWILEEPIHFFDLARWYLSSLGDPVSVVAKAKARDDSRPELADNFSAMLSFPGGAYAVVSQTLSAFEHHQVAKLTGSNGALWASWSGAMDRTFTPTFWLKHHDGETVREVPIAKPSGEVFELVEQIGAVVRAVRDGVPLHATGEDGRWAVKMCLAAQKSVETNESCSLRD